MQSVYSKLKQLWRSVAPVQKPFSDVKKRRKIQLHLEVLENRYAPAITGTVFQDFNSDGEFDAAPTIPNNGQGTIGVAQDQGVANITVIAFSDAGFAGFALTDANGQFTINPTGTGPFRIEFSNLPPGYNPGAKGAGVGATVQFVNDGANVQLGLVRPEEFSVDNPTLITSCYVFGDQATGPNNSMPVIISFPYSSGTDAADANTTNHGNPTAHALDVPANEVGSTFGLAYSQVTDQVYAAAFMKKHVGFGPNGPGAIYQMNTTGNMASLFTTLNAGADPHNTADYFTDFFDTTWDAVGKLGLGGMDNSDDGTTLYVMNLSDRMLYSIDTTNPAIRSRVGVPLNPPGSTDTNDVRPFAVEFHQGRVYIGLVNTAESTQQASDLHAYVYSAPVNGIAIGSFTLDFQFDLDYTRRFLYFGNSANGANWNPWQPTFNPNVPATLANGLIGYPQPWLTTITFDPEGNMVLGIRDRLGDQAGYEAPEDPNDPSTLYFSATGGDTLRAAINTPGDLNSGWTLESNATVGGSTSAGAGNGEGPGGGEFYFEDNANAIFGHTEVGMGGVLQIPGFPSVLTTAFDPNPLGFAGTGGVHWYNNSDGTLEKGYRLYATLDIGTTFGKAGGLGELIALPGQAPIEIGDRVWMDNDGDGIQDPSEMGIAGVTVNLYQGNMLVDTTTTNAQGEYLFTNLDPNTNYNIRLDNPADYSTGPLNGKTITVPNQGVNHMIDSDAVLQAGFPRIDYTTGDYGENDHTLDFGLQAGLSSLSGYVYRDLQINGVREPGLGETGIANTPITLTGIDTFGNMVTRMTTTDANGFYEFPDLLSGTYSVKEGLPPDFYYDGMDAVGTNLNGGTALNDCLQNLVLPAGVDSQENNFGEHPPADPFGYVYFDANRNGSRDPGEQGIPNVMIIISGTIFPGTPMERPLMASDVPGGLVTRTDTNGFWSFPILPPGIYTIREIQPREFRDGREENRDPFANTVVVGNDMFSNIDLTRFPIVGPLNFGEETIQTRFISKRFFLSSSVFMGRRINAAQRYFTILGNQTRIAQTDVNGDGIADMIVATNSVINPFIRIFDGATAQLLYSFQI